MRITRKHLDAKIGILNRMLDAPEASYIKQEDGRYKAQIGNYCLEQSLTGYQIHRISNDGGGVSCPFGHWTMTAKEVCLQLEAAISMIRIMEEAKV